MKINERSEWTHVFSGESYEERLKIDDHKRSVAEEQGFEVFYVWSDESPNQTFERVKETIHDKINKKPI